MPLITRFENGTSKVEVRAFMAVAFTAAVITGFFTDRIDSNAFLPFASMAVSWYFATRQAQEQDRRPPPPTPSP